MRIVLKIGGELLSPERRSELEAFAGDVRALADRGDSLVIIHGGGPQTTELQRKLGQEPKVIAGRRLTDDDALLAIEMVVGGRMNIELCSALRRSGVDAIGLTGVSGRAIEAVRRPPRVISGWGATPVDLGHVGDVTGVNRRLIDLLLSNGWVPVLASIGCGAAGEVYNINADVVASGVAAELAAGCLCLVTGTSGVLADVRDPDSTIPRMSLAEARRAIADGSAAGGMIPKLEESFAALERGVGRVVVLGRLAPGDLVGAIDDPGSVGTTLTIS